MKKVGIYKITNKINGKCYIGQNTGKKRTDEQKQHQSDVMKGKPSINKGKKMSDEQKRKISETQKLNRRNR